MEYCIYAGVLSLSISLFLSLAISVSSIVIPRLTQSYIRLHAPGFSDEFLILSELSMFSIRFVGSLAALIYHPTSPPTTLHKLVAYILAK